MLLEILVVNRKIIHTRILRLTIDAVVLLDRCQGGKERLAENGIKLHNILDLRTVLDTLLGKQKICQSVYDRVITFIETNRFEPLQDGPLMKRLTYYQRRRLEGLINPLAVRILDIMEAKKTNLAFSVDVTTCAELLRLVDAVGPYCCVVKTHVDILEDFNQEFVKKLTELAQKHDFVIFEDRKFADIGNTVEHQYTGGMYKIFDWADLTNAHAVPGSGVVKGLNHCGMSHFGKKRGCLLIAQMSSAGAMTHQSYVEETVKMAKDYMPFVCGFISTTAVCTDEPRLLHFTPGVSLQKKGDRFGQQYLTPEEVIKNRGCDVIIVGRGIYQAEDPVEAAKAYKEAGYKAYLESLPAS